MYNRYRNDIEDEPPLLEELGIDPKGIYMRCRSLIFARWGHSSLDELDLFGAFAIAGALGALCLLTGKAVLGPIIGWGVLGCGILAPILSALAGPRQGDHRGEGGEARPLSWYSVYCLVGYCSIAMLACMVASLVTPRGVASRLLQATGALWATLLATKLLKKKVPAFDDQGVLAAYPILLLYLTLSLLFMY